MLVLLLRFSSSVDLMLLEVDFLMYLVLWLSVLLRQMTLAELYLSMVLVRHQEQETLLVRVDSSVLVIRLKVQPLITTEDLLLVSLQAKIMDQLLIMQQQPMILVMLHLPLQVEKLIMVKL